MCKLVSFLRYGVRIDRKGAAALEFAFVLPALLLVILGIVQVGLTINNYEMLTGGTHAASRQFSLSRGSNTPYSNAKSALLNAAPNLDQTQLTQGIKLAVNGKQCADDSACKTALASGQGQPGTVTASYPCSLKFYGYDFAPGCTLKSKVTENIE